MLGFIIRIVTGLLNDRELESTLFSVVKKFITAPARTLKRKVVSIVKMYDPREWQKIIPRLPKKALNVLHSLLETSEKKNPPKGIKKLLTNQRTEKEPPTTPTTPDIVNTKNPTPDWIRKIAPKNKLVVLSSSWCKEGYFAAGQNETVGSLIIRINQDGSANWYGPYTYPMTPIRIWEQMCLAKGKNGSGAGSVFWKLWLHSYIPSRLRRHVRERISEMKLSRLELREELMGEIAQSLSKDFYDKHPNARRLDKLPKNRVKTNINHSKSTTGVLKYSKNGTYKGK